MCVCQFVDKINFFSTYRFRWRESSSTQIKIWQKNLFLRLTWRFFVYLAICLNSCTWGSATSEIGLDADFWFSRLARIVIFAISNLIKIDLCIKTNPPLNNWVNLVLIQWDLIVKQQDKTFYSDSIERTKPKLQLRQHSSPFWSDVSLVARYRFHRMALDRLDLCVKYRAELSSCRPRWVVPRSKCDTCQLQHRAELWLWVKNVLVRTNRILLWKDTTNYSYYS